MWNKHCKYKTFQRKDKDSLKSDKDSLKIIIIKISKENQCTLVISFISIIPQ